MAVNMNPELQAMPIKASGCLTARSNGSFLVLGEKYTFLAGIQNGQIKQTRKEKVARHR